jgi:hypothetical protein
MQVRFFCFFENSRLIDMFLDRGQNQILSKGSSIFFHGFCPREELMRYIDELLSLPFKRSICPSSPTLKGKESK